MRIEPAGLALLADKAIIVPGEGKFKLQRLEDSARVSASGTRYVYPQRDQTLHEGRLQAMSPRQHTGGRVSLIR